jgi:hypothetical protein
MKMKLKQTVTIERTCEVEVDPPWAKNDWKSGKPHTRPATAEEVADWLRASVAGTGLMIFAGLGVEIEWSEETHSSPVTVEPVEES